MGSITRGLSNNITTGGVILPAGITNASVSAVTSFANASAATLILLSTQTASSSASISFTTGLDSTYDEYQFHFINCHPQTDNADLTFQGSTNGGSSYGITTTSTYFETRHSENDSVAQLAYNTAFDLAQSTDYIRGSGSISNENDSGLSGRLTIFNPSSTTYVKHFICEINKMFNLSGSFESTHSFSAGYLNTTSAINAIDFKMDTGNIDDGIIKLYGVKKS
jgi:hypothetical protein